MQHIVEINYLLYVSISIAVTIWVGRTLHRNGRAFLIDGMLGNEVLADSINHLLVVGFYLINIGYICFALRFGDRPSTVADGIELLSSKLGVVLLVLGLMHFINVMAVSRWRRSAIEERRMAPPLPPPLPPAM